MCVCVHARATCALCLIAGPGLSPHGRVFKCLSFKFDLLAATVESLMIIIINDMKIGSPSDDSLIQAMAALARLESPFSKSIRDSD